MKQRIAALLLALFVCLSLAACDGSSSYSATNGMAAADSISGVKDFDFNSGGLSFATNESDTPSEPESEPETTPTTQDLNEKLIFTGNLQIETINFDASIAAIEALVTQYKGFIEQSDIDGRTTYNEDGTARIIDRSAYYILRIPATEFNTVMQQAGAIGNITSSSSEAVNVTSQFTDNEARLSSLELQEERLLAMLSQSASLSELLELEARLSDVRYEIELIERTLRDLQTSISYSTITLRLSEVAGYEQTISVQRTFIQRVGDALKDGWTGFIHGAQNVIVGIAGSLPAIIALAIVIIIIWHFAKKNKNKTKTLLQKSADAAARLADGTKKKSDTDSIDKNP